MYDVFANLLEERNLKAADVCRGTGLPSSLFSEWKKGKSTPKVDKLQKIADFFGVSLEYLTTGKERSEKKESGLNARDEKDIQKQLEGFRQQLMSQEGLMFDGDPASPEAIESILSAMEIGMAMAKKKNKERFTPKKYRKNKKD
ncbi:helix-turn-helix transcriptional regulator [Clostridioides difficile]|nr:helix-turn-helix transcriptional regulator [Clostridioides difficile]